MITVISADERLTTVEKALELGLRRALALNRVLITQRLRVEIEAGGADTVDPELAAEVIARLAISLLLTRDGRISLDDRDSLAALVRLVLLPMVRPGAPVSARRRAGGRGD